MQAQTLYPLFLAAMAAQIQLPSAPTPSEAATQKVAAAALDNGPRPRPVLIYQVAPDFSEKARKRHFSGNVEVSLLVDKDGTPQDVTVVHGVGMGLDEKAVEAVRQYRFKPALATDGTPIPMKLNVSVNFQIF